MELHKCQDDYRDELESEEELLYEKYEGVAMPTTAVERYELLKNHYGEFNFYQYKYRYRRDAIRDTGIPGENDLDKINDGIRKLEVIIDHASITNQVVRARLLEEAKLHFVRRTLGTVKSKERLDLLIFVLHEEEWFNDFRLPDEALSYDQLNDNFYKVAEVYGHYVRFYQYLIDKLKKARLSAVKKTFPKGLKKNNQNKTKKIFSGFKDLFEDETKYDEVIQVLSVDFPDSLLNKYSELKRLEGPFIILAKDESFKIDAMLPSPASYLAGLFTVCKKRGWLQKASQKICAEVLAKSFRIEENSPAAIKKASYNDLDAKYIEPFQNLLKAIK